MFANTHFSPPVTKYLKPTTALKKHVFTYKIQDNTSQYWQQLFNSINVVLVIDLVYQLREKAALSHNFTNKVSKKMICIAVYTVDNAFQMM